MLLLLGFGPGGGTGTKPDWLCVQGFRGFGVSGLVFSGLGVSGFGNSEIAGRVEDNVGPIIRRTSCLGGCSFLNKGLCRF